MEVLALTFTVSFPTNRMLGAGFGECFTCLRTRSAWVLAAQPLRIAALLLDVASLRFYSCNLLAVPPAVPPAYAQCQRFPFHHPSAMGSSNPRG